MTDTPVTTPATGGLPDASPAALDAAGALLAHLAPLYPSIAAATRTGPGAQAWVEAWARSIELSGLTRRQIERGLTRLARGEHDPETPLSWSVFYRLCYNPLLDANDAPDPAERARRLAEFKARHPGARFVN